MEQTKNNHKDMTLEELIEHVVKQNKKLLEEMEEALKKTRENENK